MQIFQTFAASEITIDTHVKSIDINYFFIYLIPDIILVQEKFSDELEKEKDNFKNNV